MYKLKYADYDGSYHGFTLKKGFYYGKDTESGKLIATSGWCSHGAVAIYFLKDKKWKMEWINIEDNVEYFSISNLPDINTDDKIPFYKWLEETQDISFNEWDEIYHEHNGKQIEAEYDSYYYDGLPEFVIKYLEITD